MIQNFKLVCPCLLGIEGLVADELRHLGAKNIEAQNGRVLLDGTPNMLARVNFNSRFSERVLLQMGIASVFSFEELFQAVKAMPWENWISAKDMFPVKGRSLNSKLSSVVDCQSIIKKAIVERLKSKYHITWFEETGNVYQIQFLIMKDQLSVMIDTSGAGLHKRGYRANSTLASLKETLAATMAYLSKLWPDSFVIDPFCGSGTILIESALLAMNIAPGLKRKFSAQNWPQIARNSWEKEKERALDLIKRDASFKAVGYDIDIEAVNLSLHNAKKAGVIGHVQAFNRDLKDFKIDENLERVKVICNPPYGDRLLNLSKTEKLYKTMGKVFVVKPGYRYTIISPNENFEKCFGRKADKRRKLYNGMIRCQVFQYFKNAK